MPEVAEADLTRGCQTSTGFVPPANLRGHPSVYDLLNAIAKRQTWLVEELADKGIVRLAVGGQAYFVYATIPFDKTASSFPQASRVCAAVLADLRSLGDTKPQVTVLEEPKVMTASYPPNPKLGLTC